jgi:hypothetical protein
LYLSEVEVEEAIKFVRVLDGVDCCNVGFVPRVQGSLKSVRECLDGFVIVAELYSFFDNNYKNRSPTRTEVWQDVPS